MATTRLNGSSGQAGYGYYANVIVNETINNNNTFTVQVNTYLVNNGSRTNSNGWTKHSRIDQANEPHERTLTSQTVNTTGVDRYGGETLIQSETYYVPISVSSMYVVCYLSKSSYASYEPGYCILAGWVSTPKVQSMWNSSLLSIPNITQSFQLPITKYVSEYYDVVEIRNQNNQTLIKTINNATNNTSVTFSSSELNTLYTMDNNRNQQNIRFYMDLKTYTNSSKTTQIGTTQRLTCDGYLVNSEPTATYTVVEQDANVISLLGSSTSTKIIKESSDLLFTITPTTKNGALVSSVKVNGANATLSGNNYILNATNITTNTFNIVVTDTRNYSTTYTITKTLLDYMAIKINSWTSPRASQTSSNLVLTADITCYSSTIDGNTNTPTVQYSTDNSTWTTISSSSYTFTNNKITISNLTLSNLIPYQQAGKIYLKITDLLTSANDNNDVAVGIYTWAIGDRKARLNGTLEIADSSGNNRINITQKYKANNEMLIGYWIDGNNTKKVYRTVITGTSTSNGVKTYSTGITGLSTLVKFYGVYANMYPIPYATDTAGFTIEMYMNNNGSVSIKYGSAITSGIPIRIVIEYTKTNE